MGGEGGGVVGSPFDFISRVTKVGYGDYKRGLGDTK